MAKEKKDLTQEDILAWADQISGVPATETARRQGCHENTVAARRKRVAEFIAEKFDINEYRMPLYALYPIWLRSVINNLKKDDTQMTIAFGKGMNLFVDKFEGDLTTNATPAELERIITEALGVTNSEAEGGAESGDGVKEDAP